MIRPEPSPGANYGQHWLLAVGGDLSDPEAHVVHVFAVRRGPLAGSVLVEFSPEFLDEIPSWFFVLDDRVCRVTIAGSELARFASDLSPECHRLSAALTDSAKILSEAGLL